MATTLKIFSAAELNSGSERSDRRGETFTVDMATAADLRWLETKQINTQRPLGCYSMEEELGWVRDMQPGPEDRSGQPGRSRRTCVRSSKEEATRTPVVFSATCHREKQVGGTGEGRRREEGGGQGGAMKRSVTVRRAASEGGGSSEESRELRWRLNQLEKEKLKLTSSHNQEVCTLQAEVARLRSSVERGEAQRAKLQYQLAASRRDGERVAELARDGRALTEQAAELQQTVAELQKALRITQQARQEDQQALQQEVEERDQLIQNFSSENQRLHQLLQDQEAALEESERKMADVQQERQKEAEVNRRQAEELKSLAERSCREKELTEQRAKSLESSIEAERAAHLESRCSLEVLQQLRTQDLEAAVAVERSGQQEAQRGLELLLAHLRELERVYSLEGERRGRTEHALQRLQTEFDHCKSDMTVALETERKVTSDLSRRLEEERSQHASTQSQLQQAARQQSETEEAFLSTLEQIAAMLQLGTVSQQPAQPAKNDGKPSPAEVLQLLATTLSAGQQRLEQSSEQVQDLLDASETLREEKRLLQQLASDQQKQTEEARRALVKLQEVESRLCQQSSDWSVRNEELQEELRRAKEERMKEVQEMSEEFNKETAARLSFLHRLYQRLLTGCVLIDQPQSILGDFTWKELCDAIGEQVDRLTSDLQMANDKIAHLQGVCDKKSVSVRELQRSQECVLACLEESVRRREEAWSHQHTHTVNQLQLCRAHCDSHRDRASSLERRCSSLTSDLTRLRGLLSRSRRESSSFLSACALLGGALRHARGCVRALSEQKVVLGRRLAERELLEQEVRRLADALGGEKTKEEEERGRRTTSRRRWRRSVCAVMAVKRWTALRKRTMVLFRLEGGGGSVAVCMGGSSPTAAPKGENDDGPEGVCSRWLRSKSLSSIILSSMADLQRALAHTGSSPPNVISAARSGFSRLLDHLLDQSDHSVSSLKLSQSGQTSRQPSMKTLVSALQQHFLLFSQRLHSAEVERRSLRLDVANLKKGLRLERAEFNQMVPSERFRTACEELRQALGREQEAQALIQEQSNQLQALQQRTDTNSSEQSDAQRTLSQTKQALSRKERSLRILGKHLSGVQKERRQLEEQLRDAARRQEFVIRSLKAAETSCRQVRESLVQSQHSVSTHRSPLLFAQEHLDPSGTKHLMGAPEVAACQSFLSVVSQLHHACSSRIDWLEQEVSAHRSHVTALRGELQDACLRESLAYVPVGPQVEELNDDGETRHLPPLSGFSEEAL